MIGSFLFFAAVCMLCVTNVDCMQRKSISALHRGFKIPQKVYQKQLIVAPTLPEYVRLLQKQSKPLSITHVIPFAINKHLQNMHNAALQDLIEQKIGYCLDSMLLSQSLQTEVILPKFICVLHYNAVRCRFCFIVFFCSFCCIHTNKHKLVAGEIVPNLKKHISDDTHEIYEFISCVVAQNLLEHEGLQELYHFAQNGKNCFGMQPLVQKKSQSVIEAIQFMVSHQITLHVLRCALVLTMAKFPYTEVRLVTCEPSLHKLT